MLTCERTLRSLSKSEECSVLVVNGVNLVQEVWH